MNRLEPKPEGNRPPETRKGETNGDKRKRTAPQTGSAIAMLAAGTVLSAIGFAVPPLGEISDSVLWMFSQCLLYAGSIFGVTSYVNGKFKEMDDMRAAHGNGRDVPSQETNG